MWNEWPALVQCMIQGAWGWCIGMTQRDGMGRGVGGGFKMGNTCTPMVDSCQCKAKPLQYCKVKKKKRKKKLIGDSQWNFKYSRCSFRDKNLKSPKHCKARRNYLSLAKYFFDAHLLSYCVLGHGHTSKSKMLSLFSWSSKSGGGPTWKQATAIWHHMSCEVCDGSTEPWGSTRWGSMISREVFESLPRGSRPNIYRLRKNQCLLKVGRVLPMWCSGKEGAC